MEERTRNICVATVSILAWQGWESLKADLGKGGGLSRGKALAAGGGNVLQTLFQVTAFSLTLMQQDLNWSPRI